MWPLRTAELRMMYIMEDTGYAAPTVVTDGYRVAAIFAGGDAGFVLPLRATRWASPPGST